MSAKGMLYAMLGVSGLAMFAAGRPDAARKETPAHLPAPETPWLSSEAAAQIIGADGRLGPLFSGVELGGPAPSPAVREQIATFARTNHATIELEVVDDTLMAVRFDVVYAGCCGYEGADVLAMRLRRPTTSECCGCTKSWINEWAVATDGVYMHARVHVNRVTVRWEREATLPELLDRAEALLGADASKVRDASRAWTEIEPHHFEIELPYMFAADPAYEGVQVQQRGEFGLQVAVASGHIVEVSLSIPGLDNEPNHEAAAALRSRWGRPRVRREDAWTWRKADRAITAQLDAWPPRLLITARP